MKIVVIIVNLYILFRIPYFSFTKLYFHSQGLDISTNKATDEEMQGVPQHMIGFVEPNVTGFNVIQFRDRILQKIRQLWDNKKLPVLVGGTSYYIEAVLWHQLIKEEGDSDLGPQDFKDWYLEG